jgi:hypothetical protein
MKSKKKFIIQTFLTNHSMAVFSLNSILIEKCGDSQKNVEKNFDFRAHILIPYDQLGNNMEK